MAHPDLEARNKAFQQRWLLDSALEDAALARDLRKAVEEDTYIKWLTDDAFFDSWNQQQRAAAYARMGIEAPGSPITDPGYRQPKPHQPAPAAFLLNPERHSLGDSFTRADWRPSKRRKMQKRKNHYAGKKVAPPAFLAAAQKVQFGSGRHRICRATKRDGSPCGMIALSGLPICGAHGGFGAWAKMGKLQKSGRSAAHVAAQKEAKTNPNKQPNANPLSELIKLNVYKYANQWTKTRLARAWNTQAWPALIRQLKQGQAIIPL